MGLSMLMLYVNQYVYSRSLDNIVRTNIFFTSSWYELSFPTVLKLAVYLFVVFFSFYVTCDLLHIINDIVLWVCHFPSSFTFRRSLKLDTDVANLCLSLRSLTYGALSETLPPFILRSPFDSRDIMWGQAMKCIQTND